MNSDPTQPALNRRNSFTFLAAFLVSISSFPAHAREEVLVADRITNRILRYNEKGEYLGTLVTDTNNTFSVPSSLVLSPDGTHLYIASRGTNRVVRYDYNGMAATNPLVIVSAGASTISQPAGLLFDLDGTLLVANSANNNSTVARFSPDGASAGASLTGGPNTGRTGLAFGPDNVLLALNYATSASAGGGGVLQYDTNLNSFVNLVAPTPQLRGAANLVVKGDHLYVAGSIAGTVGKFNARSGATDTAFATNGYVSGLVFPASLALAPDDDTSLLVGILGANNNGTGWISRYSPDGVNLGVWASATLVSSNLQTHPGFREATALLVVPSLGTLDIVRNLTSNTISVSWPGIGWTLEEASDVTGPWTNSLSQVSPVSVRPDSPRKFFRLIRP